MLEKKAHSLLQFSSLLACLEFEFSFRGWRRRLEVWMVGWHLAVTICMGNMMLVWSMNQCWLTAWCPANVILMWFQSTSTMQCNGNEWINLQNFKRISPKTQFNIHDCAARSVNGACYWVHIPFRCSVKNRRIKILFMFLFKLGSWWLLKVFWVYFGWLLNLLLRRCCCCCWRLCFAHFHRGHYIHEWMWNTWTIG